MVNKRNCRLCGELKKLRESHIVPKGMFKLIRGKKLNSRFYRLHEKKDHIIQDGPKEYLLCDSCEGKIGQYEKYFKESIHLSRHGITIKQNNTTAIIENLDYRKVKLFFLSLLWRMSISSLPEFENIYVDNEIELKKMLVEENPGKAPEYPVVAIIPLIDNKMQEAWGTNANAIVLDNSQTIIFYIVMGGILYCLSPDRQNKYLENKSLLNETGSWFLPLIDIKKISFLWQNIQDHFER